MWRAAVLVLICMSMCVFGGCASIFCGAEKTININSNPTGAKYQITDISGKVICEGITPGNETLKRGRGWFKASDYSITMLKDGYQDTTKPIRQDLEAGWYLGGNILFGGLIGWIIVDPLTGAMWSIEDVHVELITNSVGFDPIAKAMRIDQVPQYLRDRMVRIN